MRVSLLTKQCFSYIKSGAMLKLIVNTLPQGESSFNFIVEPAQIGVENLVNEPISASIVVFRQNKEVDVRGTLSFVLCLECSRCLERFTLSVEEEVTGFYRVPEGEVKGEEVVLEEEELDILVYDGEVVDLTGLFRDTVILAVPLKPLCREDCKGLCPYCGVNRNKEQCKCEAEYIDPRWRALLDIKFDEEGGK